MVSVVSVIGWEGGASRDRVLAWSSKSVTLMVNEECVWW